FPGIVIIAGAASGLVEAQFLVEGSGRLVGVAHFEKDGFGALLAGGSEKGSHELGSQTVTTRRWCYQDILDFPFLHSAARDEKTGWSGFGFGLDHPCPPEPLGFQEQGFVVAQ